MFSANSDAAAPSIRRSSSSSTQSAKASTTSTGRSRRSFGIDPLDKRGEPAEQHDVAGELRLDSGPQHFDRDFRAFVGHREMNLRDRCRRDRRLGRSCRRARSSGAPSSRSMVAIALSDGKGGIWACRVDRSTSDILADEVRPHRQRLAEFDEARAQLDHRRGQPFARPALRPYPGEAAEQPEQRRRRAGLFERKERVMLRQRPRDRDEPSQVVQRAPHGTAPRGG